MSGRQIIALLGRRDSPTDALEDYCAELGRALETHGYTFRTMRVPWAERGWIASVRRLQEQAGERSDACVLVQYTALSWSRHGFPLGLLPVLHALRRRRKAAGLRAVVFHDAEPYGGSRPIDWLRRVCQRGVMRVASRWADRVILTVPAERVSWLPRAAAKAAFIPVGANAPDSEIERHAKTLSSKVEKTVAIFGLTGGTHIPAEAREIADAVGCVARQLSGLRLVVLGRNSAQAKEHLVKALDGANVKLSVLGLLPAAEIVRCLAQADVLLFVRGPISTCRGSAIAGIACGLPVVGYAGSETAPPISEAGVVLVPGGSRKALADALGRVLTDEAYADELRCRSRAAWRRYFSWEAIANRYLDVLEPAAVRARREVSVLP